MWKLVANVLIKILPSHIHSIVSSFVIIWIGEMPLACKCNGPFHLWWEQCDRNWCWKYLSKVIIIVEIVWSKWVVLWVTQCQRAPVDQEHVILTPIELCPGCQRWDQTPKEIWISIASTRCDQKKVGFSLLPLLTIDKERMVAAVIRTDRISEAMSESLHWFDWGQNGEFFLDYVGWTFGLWMNNEKQSERV